MAHVQNTMELIERTEIDPLYDMCANNADDIYKKYHKSAFHLICSAFKFGYAQGQKAIRAELKKQRQQ